MKSVNLEPIVPAQWDVVYDIFRDIHPELTNMEGMTGNQMEELLKIQYEIRQEQLKQLYPNAERNFIMFDGAVAGLIYTDTGSDLRIIEIGLLQKYRRRGIGSIVVAKVLEEAKALGKGVSLQVLWCNYAALQFYERLGFSMVQNNQVTYEMNYKYNP